MKNENWIEEHPLFAAAGILVSTPIMISSIYMLEAGRWIYSKIKEPKNREKFPRFWVKKEPKSRTLYAGRCPVFIIND